MGGSEKERKSVLDRVLRVLDRLEIEGRCDKSVSVLTGRNIPKYPSIVVNIKFKLNPNLPRKAHKRRFETRPSAPLPPYRQRR